MFMSFDELQRIERIERIVKNIKANIEESAIDYDDSESDNQLIQRYKTDLKQYKTELKAIYKHYNLDMTMYNSINDVVTIVTP